MLVLEIPIGGGVRIGDATIKIERTRGDRVRLLFDVDRSIAIQMGRHVRHCGRQLILEGETCKPGDGESPKCPADAPQ